MKKTPWSRRAKGWFRYGNGFIECSGIGAWRRSLIRCMGSEFTDAADATWTTTLAHASCLPPVCPASRTSCMQSCTERRRSSSASYQARDFTNWKWEAKCPKFMTSKRAATGLSLRRWMHCYIVPATSDGGETQTFARSVGRCERRVWRTHCTHAHTHAHHITHGLKTKAKRDERWDCLLKCDDD